MSVAIVPPLAVHEVPVDAGCTEVCPLLVVLVILGIEPALHLGEVGFGVEGRTHGVGHGTESEIGGVIA